MSDQGNQGYRYFVDRVYLIGGSESKEETVENIRSVIIDKQLSDGEYAILDIDLSHHNIGLWEDCASDRHYNVYTYEAIPPFLIVRYVRDVDALFDN